MKFEYELKNGKEFVNITYTNEEIDAIVSDCTFKKIRDFLFKLNVEFEVSKMLGSAFFILKFNIEHLEFKVRYENEDIVAYSRLRGEKDENGEPAEYVEVFTLNYLQFEGMRYNEEDVMCNYIYTMLSEIRENKLS